MYVAATRAATRRSLGAVGRMLWRFSVVRVRELPDSVVGRIVARECQRAIGREPDAPWSREMVGYRPGALVFAVNATCLDRRAVCNIVPINTDSPSGELMTLAFDTETESVRHQLNMPIGRPAAGVLESFLADARPAGGAHA